MISTICPNCSFHNSPGANSCENCSVSLERQTVIMRPDDSVIVAGRQLPARQLKRLGASIVVSAVALLAEVGFVYLRRRLRHIEMPALIPKRKAKLPVTVKTQSNKTVTSGKRVVSVYSERVVEELRWGRPVRRIVNRMAWRSEETIES